MSIEANKEIVRRFFSEAVDGLNAEILDEFFTEDCVCHRPESAEPTVGIGPLKRRVQQVLDGYREQRTAIHDLIAEGDGVVCRLSHRAVHRGAWTSRLGRHEVAGRPVSWTAIDIFRFRDGKIAEQWVCRDELGMLMQLDALPLGGSNPP